MEKQINLKLVQEAREFNNKGYYDQNYLKSLLIRQISAYNETCNTDYLIKNYKVTVDNDESYWNIIYMISFIISSEKHNEIDIIFEIDKSQLRLNRMSYTFFSTHRVKNSMEMTIENKRNGKFGTYILDKNNNNIDVNSISNVHSNFCLISFDEYMETVDITSHGNHENYFFDKVRKINENNILNHYLYGKKYAVKIGNTEIIKGTYNEEDYYKIYSRTRFEFIDNIPEKNAYFLNGEHFSEDETFKLDFSEYEKIKTGFRKYKYILKESAREKYQYNMLHNRHRSSRFIYITKYEEELFTRGIDVYIRLKIKIYIFE